MNDFVNKVKIIYKTKALHFGIFKKVASQTSNILVAVRNIY